MMNGCCLIMCYVIIVWAYGAFDVLIAERCIVPITDQHWTSHRPLALLISEFDVDKTLKCEKCGAATVYHQWPCIDEETGDHLGDYMVWHCENCGHDVDANEGNA